ncbi:hypothetical protein K469DRAFT_12421 [Zopfia rhizophila CBS 207.26]|uniref:Uncharacterized protein n=1 Tax=Zopfia rhizophila CBS 207.26 TaxID=1314779 RepID=A0A6A6EWP7_9PEZI|nr:hypothetical protein K469DRAFT_12421 [Zopfia rhizophila CBS 207.26]
MTADANDLLPMGEALAEIFLDLIYHEAKLQFDALKSEQPTVAKTAITPFAAVTTNNSRRPNSAVAKKSSENVVTSIKDPKELVPQTEINLSEFYQNLFDNATKELNDGLRYRLLTICFAYKTKENIERFLLLLSGGFPWVGVFRAIIRGRAYDSAFEELGAAWDAGIGDVGLDGQEPDVEMEMEVDTGDHTIDPLVTFKLQHMAKKAQQLLKSLEEKTRSTGYGSLPGFICQARTSISNCVKAFRPGSSGRPVMVVDAAKPYFILPTLPLAFPTVFFNSLATHAPLKSLNLPNILSCPAALQLALSASLVETMYSTHFSYCNGASRQESEWSCFLDHLMDGKLGILLPDKELLLFDEDEGGYGEMDLEMWLAAWKGARQSLGVREKGQEKMLKIQLRLKDTKDGTLVAEDKDSEVYLMEGAGEEERRGGRVEWNGELEQVKEIPAREKKRRRKRAKRNW